MKVLIALSVAGIVCAILNELLDRAFPIPSLAWMRWFHFANLFVIAGVWGALFVMWIGGGL